MQKLLSVHTQFWTWTNTDPLREKLWLRSSLTILRQFSDYLDLPVAGLVFRSTFSISQMSGSWPRYHVWCHENIMKMQVEFKEEDYWRSTYHVVNLLIFPPLVALQQTACGCPVRQNFWNVHRPCRQFSLVWKKMKILGTKYVQMIFNKIDTF